MGTGPLELMHTSDPAEHCLVADHDVPGELRVVGERRVVADHAVMRNVAVREQQVAIADGRRAAILCRPRVDADKLADDVVVADDRCGRLASVLAVLRYVADGRELEDAVAPADARTAGNHRMTGDRRAITDV